MKERIKQIMDAEDMTPARLADTLQIGRAIVSHILNGRNNPSLDVITRILAEMPQINAEWLISGNGQMYKIGNGEGIEGRSGVGLNLQPDLFSQIPINKDKVRDNNEYRKENEFTSPSKPIQDVVNERIIYREVEQKKVSQIIVYYNDNSYETFRLDK